jgi:hypothetical protein
LAVGYPKTRYKEQIELLVADLKRPRTRKNQNGSEETFDNFSRIIGVREDSTGLGDFPMEFSHLGLPIAQGGTIQNFAGCGSSSVRAGDS